MIANADFQIQADASARAWLDSHRLGEPRIISYDVKRCCGGGRICIVQVREQSRRDDRRTYVTAALEDGTRILVDRRAAERLPSRFRLTVRGLGPLKHLELDLDGEQWGALLYD